MKKKKIKFPRGIKRMVFPQPRYLFGETEIRLRDFLNNYEIPKSAQEIVYQRRISLGENLGYDNTEIIIVK